MTIEEYFGDWKSLIDMRELGIVLGKLNKVNPALVCPSMANIFRAFELCSHRDLKVVMLGMDPYPQKGVATGVLFGNKADVPEDNLSPSLQVIKEAAINYEMPHGVITFDQTMESWAKQGILMINSALTCEMNKIGAHVMWWRPFMTKLLKNLSERDAGIMYVLFGRQAQTFEPYINKQYNEIIKIEHPAYFARTKQLMPHSVFTDINRFLKGRYGITIEWYQDSNNDINFNENESERDFSGDFFWPCSL